jgi:hypothetical protein
VRAERRRAGEVASRGEMASVLPSLRQLALAESDVATQLVLLGAQAALWFWLVPAFAEHVGRPFLTSRSWFAQWSELTNHYFLSLFGVALPRSTTDKIGFEWTGILFQHGVGALLCVPAMLGLLSPEVRVALALHGSLCEAGWELQDALCRVHAVTLGGPDKRALNPPAVLRFFAAHHVIGLGMVIPMNLLFRDNAFYHEGVFMLQGCAFLAMAAQLYGYSLDTATAGGLRRMRAAVTTTFAAMFWSRGLRYGVIVYNVLASLLASGNTPLFLGGCLAASCMGWVNHSILSDAWRKLVKFWRVPSSFAAGTTAQRRLLRKASSEAISDNTRGRRASCPSSYTGPARDGGGRRGRAARAGPGGGPQAALVGDPRTTAHKRRER